MPVKQATRRLRVPWNALLAAPKGGVVISRHHLQPQTMVIEVAWSIAI